MNTSLAKHIFSLQSVPLYAIVLASLTSCGLLLMHMMVWQLWLMALLILLVWSPILAMKTRDIYRQSRWLAFLACSTWNGSTSYLMLVGYPFVCIRCVSSSAKAIRGCGI